MRKVTIVHLSDIHFDNSEKSNELFEALEKDLIEKMKEIGKLDLLFITGDTINKGNVKFFKDFEAKLNDLLRKCKISKKKTIISIGNHDVSLCTRQLKRTLKDFSAQNISEEEMIDEIENSIDTYYKDYNTFNSNYLITRNGIGVNDLTINNIKFRLISLNSSWSAMANKKYGELIIGEKQWDTIKKLLDKKNKERDCTILYMHHPIDWFTYKERDKIKKFIYDENINLFLHGHIHISGADVNSNIDNVITTLYTGISYHKKDNEDSSRKDGQRYSIYELNKDTNTINVYIRSTNDLSSFVPDNRLFNNCLDGFFTIPLGSSYECLLPFNTANNNNKAKIFLDSKNVNKILLKEKTLVKVFNRVINAVRESKLNLQNEREQKLDAWRKIKPNMFRDNNYLTESGESEFNMEFYTEQFEWFFLLLASELKSAFFEKYENIRFLVRMYNPLNNMHEAKWADGIYSTESDLKEIKSFKWKEGLIYYSYKCKKPLLKSFNEEYYANGNSIGRWKESLTITIDEFKRSVEGEDIPIFSINIATTTEEHEKCLQALSFTSIYEVLKYAFKYFDDEIYNLNDLQ